MMVNPDPRRIELLYKTAPCLIPGEAEGQPSKLKEDAPEEIKEAYNEWLSLHYTIEYRTVEGPDGSLTVFAAKKENIINEIIAIPPTARCCCRLSASHSAPWSAHTLQ